MATNKDFLDYILEQLSPLGNITYRSMMGEYVLYMDGKIAAYICDDRLLVKPTKTALSLLPNAKLEPPYSGAKNMVLIEEIDNKDFLVDLFNSIFDELEYPKKRRKSN